MRVIDLVLPHVAMDHQERKILTIVEDILHEAILREATPANVHQEEDVMMTMDGIMEEGAPLHQEDDWTTDMDMDPLPHDGGFMTMILTKDLDHLHLVAILLLTAEVKIHMRDHEAHHQDMPDMVAMRMPDTRDVIGKFFLFQLLTGCPEEGMSCRSTRSFFSVRTGRSFPPVQRSIDP